MKSFWYTVGKKAEAKSMQFRESMIHFNYEYYELGIISSYELAESNRNMSERYLGIANYCYNRLSIDKNRLSEKEILVAFWRSNGIYPAFMKLKRLIKKYVRLKKNQSIESRNDLIYRNIEQIVSEIKKDEWLSDYLQPYLGEITTANVVNACTLKNRTRPIVNLRTVIYYLLRNSYGYKYIDIGHFFSRDHSTILHHVDKMWDMIIFNVYEQTQLVRFVQSFETVANIRKDPLVSILLTIKKQFSKLYKAIHKITGFGFQSIKSCIRNILTDLLGINPRLLIELNGFTNSFTNLDEINQSRIIKILGFGA